MNNSPNYIDTERFAGHLRARAIDLAGRRILISRLSGSRQEVDLTRPVTCGGFGRVRHFREATSPGWPINPLPIVPACRALGVKSAPDVMTAVVFQNAACPWRCWYCYVPEELLNADVKRAEWFTADELVEFYRQIPDAPRIIDLSGGSPDLVPEWTPWMMRALMNAGLEHTTYLWTDDNLSTTYLFEKVSTDELDLLHEYRNYGRVCCVKGFDHSSFTFNTRAAPLGYDQQFEILRKVIGLGIDVYGYVTLTGAQENGIRQGVHDLVDRLQAVEHNFPLRVVPLQIQMFAPVEQRVERSRERSLAVQEEAIAAWNAEITSRFEIGLRTRPICDVPLGGAVG